MALRPNAAFSVYFALNQKNETQERIGTVKEILNKDALFVDFDDRRSSVVKFFGLKMASEREMLDGRRIPERDFDPLGIRSMESV